MVQAALDRGHAVTMFNRGETNPDLFPDVEKLRGDRDGGLDVLADGRWDACIDVSGYLPRVVRASAELLRDRVGHYTFISSLSIYVDGVGPGVTEDDPVIVLDNPTVEEITGETYGGLKCCARK